MRESKESAVVVVIREVAGSKSSTESMMMAERVDGQATR